MKPRRYGTGSGPGPITPDGCAVDLYAALPPGTREADVIASVAPPGAAILELGAGAGRVTHSLVARGRHVVAVDESADMLARVVGAETVVATIEGLALDRLFDVVVLGSHLVNVPDPDLAAQLLATCARHVAPAGSVLVERHPPKWFDDLREMTTESAGVRYRVSGVRRPAPDLLAATIEYAVDERTWAHTFTTRRVADDEIAAMFAHAGLHLAGFADDQRAWAIGRATGA